MNTKDEKVLVKLVKKAVGLPTAGSSCGCSASAPAPAACCNAEAALGKEEDCACDGSEEKEEEHPAETA